MFHKRTLLVYVGQTERGGRGSILGWGVWQAFAVSNIVDPPMI